MSFLSQTRSHPFFLFPVLSVVFTVWPSVQHVGRGCFQPQSVSVKPLQRSRQPANKPAHLWLQKKLYFNNASVFMHIFRMLKDTLQQFILTTFILVVVSYRRPPLKRSLIFIRGSVGNVSRPRTQQWRLGRSRFRTLRLQDSLLSHRC